MNISPTSEACAPRVLPLSPAFGDKHKVMAGKQKTIPSRQLQSVRDKYNKFVESGKLDFLANNVISLTAATWIAGDFIKIGLTAMNLKTTGSNAVTSDEKFATVMKTAADGLVNILLYWVPFFAITPLAIKGARYVLGKKASKKVVNFTGELASLVPIASLYYGAGSLIATKLANTAIDNKDKLKQMPLVESIMRLGESSPTKPVAELRMRDKSPHRARPAHGLALAASNMEVNN